MATEEFQQIMARLRAREQALDESFAAAELEFRDYANDHRNFIAAVDADQKPASVPQHPVAEALNAFSSTQVVAVPAPDPDADVQMNDAEESLFIPENPVPGSGGDANMIDTGESLFIPDDPAPGSDTDAKMIDTGASLPMPEKSTAEELSAPIPPPSRPKRRVTFADAATVFAGMTSPGGSEHGQQSSAAESVALKVPSDDAHLRYTKPQITGTACPSKYAYYSIIRLTLIFDTVTAPVIPTNTPTLNPQNFVGTYDPCVPAGGPIMPLRQEEYDGLNARADEVDTHFVCPFPGCEHMYSNSSGVDRHLRRDHPDWALIKDQVIGPNSE
jgi:hypothetical protein